MSCKRCQGTAVVTNIGGGGSVPGQRQGQIVQRPLLPRFPPPPHGYHRVQVCQLLAIRMRLRELRGLTHRLSPRLHELQLGVRNVTMSNVTM